MDYFEYKQPANLKEASQWLANPDRNVLPFSGGTDLLGLIKHGIVKPETLVNLKALKGLDAISHKKGEGVTIGAQVKIAELMTSELIKNNFPLLAEAAGQVASTQLRNVGTIGGNLCQRPRCWYFRGEFDCLRKGGEICYAVGGENKFHCITGGNPCFIVHPSDMAVALLAAEARISIFSADKIKTIPIGDFFILPEDDVMKENILRPGDIVTEIFVPEIPKDTKSQFIKVKERAAWDFAVVSLAGVFRIKGKKIESGKLAFGGIAPKPWMDAGINQKLSGLDLTTESIARFAADTFRDAEPMEKNEYKIRLIRNLITRQLESLI